MEHTLKKNVLLRAPSFALCEVPPSRFNASSRPRDDAKLARGAGVGFPSPHRPVFSAASVLVSSGAVSRRRSLGASAADVYCLTVLEADGPGPGVGRAGSFEAAPLGV